MKIIIYIKQALIIIAVISLGLLAINQGLGYYYKSRFLQTPCNLCIELNPHLRDCFKEASTYKVNPFTNEVIGNPKLVEEINKRENKNYTSFDWYFNYS